MCKLSNLSVKLCVHEKLMILLLFTTTELVDLNDQFSLIIVLNIRCSEHNQIQFGFKGNKRAISNVYNS